MYPCDRHRLKKIKWKDENIFFKKQNKIKVLVFEMIFWQHMIKLFFLKNQCELVWVREKYINEIITNPRPGWNLFYEINIICKLDETWDGRKYMNKSIKNSKRMFGKTANMPNKYYMHLISWLKNKILKMVAIA
jgi:hypothetical protein